VIGKTVSHYNILEKLGEGGMGVVYKAEDTRLDRMVALKFLSAHLCQDEESRIRFTREAKAAAKLDHSNIVPVYEVGEFQGRPFFAMAYIEGKSLRDVIKEGKLTISGAIDLTMQICEGLNEAHTTGVVHRDIKPGNIFIDRKNKARLLDFGLATVTGENKLTKTGSTLGTVGYMSPEQVRGEKTDHRSDLFSVGSLLYEMITGRLPFDAEHEAAIQYKIVNEVPEPLARYKSGLTDELQQIVDRALTKDPSLRYQHADDMLADLKRLKAVSGPAKKSRLGLWVAAGLALIAVAYFGLKSLEDDSVAERSTGRVMLAILPFENLGSLEDEYFADGMTDEITSRVAVLNGLGVIARTSILQYKGTTKRISEIGEELGVDYILEGTIRWDKSGQVDKVRITPQLIRVSDETHLWADNLQRDLSEIFEVQEEIATQIAGELNITLLSGEQKAHVNRPTENLEAYDYYLRARNYLDHGDNLKAIELLDKATELDSTFALAFALKSQSHSIYAFDRELGASEHSRPARLAYQRAFKIQRDLAEAHLARGIYLNLIERDYSSALKEFELARQGPVAEAQVLSAISIVKMRQGKWHEAIALDKQVIKLDPRSYQAGLASIQANWYLHQYDEALEAVERAISLAPDQASSYLVKAQIQICMGADIEQIQQTLTEWLAKGTSPLTGVEGLATFELLRLWNMSTDVDATISLVKSVLLVNQDPNLYFSAGLLYRSIGDERASYLYMDSTRIVIENRVAEALSDTTGRFEDFALENHIYEFLALAYSQTNRHKLAIEHAQLAMESSPVEACHW